MKSMTGFAKRQCSVTGHRLSIEIRTLNSKQLDITAKLPTCLKGLEYELRSLLAPLERGKVELIITDELDTNKQQQPNIELIKERYNAIKGLLQEMGEPTAGAMQSVLAQNDVWNSESDEDNDAEMWQELLHTVAEAVAETNQFRADEGAVLRKDFDKHVDIIEAKLQEIPQYEQERIETAKSRIRKYMADFAITEVDNNRFEQELIYYLEKLDITEEKVRLKKHIDYFRATMDDTASTGKKLGFVAQEMGREINTIGSKANHATIQRLVVEMKDELEKIKEQLGNIL